MNITDLRDELERRTEDLRAELPSVQAGVAGKVRATKRRRAAAGVAAVCAVAAIAGITVWSGMDRSAPPVPAVSRPAPTVGADESTWVPERLSRRCRNPRASLPEPSWGCPWR